MTPIKNRKDLETTILEEMKRYGAACSLNHLDISSVQDLSYLFCPKNTAQFAHAFHLYQSDELDMGAALCVSEYLFNYELSHFCGDISKWDVCHVRNMNYLFKDAQFDGDLAQWNIHPDCSTRMVFSKFHCSPLGIMSLLQGQVHLDRKPKGWKSWVAACKSMDLSLYDTAQFIYQQWKHPSSAPKMPEMPTDLFGPL